MPDLALEVLTLAPLHAGALKPYGQFLETGSDLPGTLLRGALAERLLREAAALGFDANHEACVEPSVCPFCHYTTGVVFPFCIPGSAGVSSDLAPRTLMTCKRAPGFRADATRPGEAPHGVRDTLLPHITHSEAARAAPFVAFPAGTCWCGEQLEPFRARYVYGAPRQPRRADRVHLRRLARGGLNRARETAESGFLYSVQVIEEGTRFVGRLWLPDEWDDTRVAEFTAEIEQVRYLGGGQSRGLGAVEVRVVGDWPADEPLSARVEEFNAALAGVWAQVGPPRPPAEQYFSLLLLTPALLTAPDGASTLELTPGLLAAEAAGLGYVNLPPLDRVSCAVSPDDERLLMFVGGQVIGGWSAAWGLPKPTALAAVAGSVYVFRAPSLSPWFNALDAIERRRLGARREEGFGAIRICDPIHREVEPV